MINFSFTFFGYWLLYMAWLSQSVSGRLKSPPSHSRQLLNFLHKSLMSSTKNEFSYTVRRPVTWGYYNRLIMGLDFDGDNLRVCLMRYFFYKKCTFKDDNNTHVTIVVSSGDWIVQWDNLRVGYTLGKVSFRASQNIRMLYFLRKCSSSALFFHMLWKL